MGNVIIAIGLILAEVRDAEERLQRSNYVTESTTATEVTATAVAHIQQAAITLLKV